MSLNWMPGIYSFPLTDAQQLFHACIRPWSQHVLCVRWHSAGHCAAVFIFSAFFNLNVSVCLLSSLLWAFIHYRSVLWKSHISINSAVLLLPVSSMEVLVSKESFVDKMSSTVFLHIQGEQSTNQALGDNTCNCVYEGMAWLHTHTNSSLHIVFDHTGIAEALGFFSPYLFFSSDFWACVAIEDYYFSAGGITSLMVVDPWRILLTLVMSGLITCHPAKQKRIDLEKGMGVYNEGPNNLLLKPGEYKNGLNVKSSLFFPLLSLTRADRLR